MALQEVKSIQEVQAPQVVQEKREKMALREAQAEMAGTEEMVHRGPEVMYFDGGEVVRVSALHL
jgi:hypothetical protein